MRVTAAMESANVVTYPGELTASMPGVIYFSATIGGGGICYSILSMQGASASSCAYAYIHQVREQGRAACCVRAYAYYCTRECLARV